MWDGGGKGTGGRGYVDGVRVEKGYKGRSGVVSSPSLVVET